MYTRRAVIQAHYKAYQKASKKQRGVILDDLAGAIGGNRDYLAHVLARYGKARYIRLDGKPVRLVAKDLRKGRHQTNRGGRPKVYDQEFVSLLKRLWDHFGRRCGKLLAPMLKAMIDFVAADGEFPVSEKHRGLLVWVSPSTIDCLLKPVRKKLVLKGKSLTKPPYALKSRIPICAFSTTEERKKPGFRQIDTVHHYGQATTGQYVHALTATDVASAWLELHSLLNNAHSWTFKALSDIKHTVPFPPREFHSDNGSEFINHATEIWCKKENLPFTRSRDHQRDDNCFVEQKNGAVVREYIGYDRLEGLEEQALLSAVYAPLVPLLNFFMPTQKLTSKTRMGSKEIRVYDEPRSPFQRLIENEELPQEYKNSFRTRCSLYNPVELQQNVNKAILRLRQRFAQANRIQTQKQD
jgi:hypothetical protein